MQALGRHALRPRCTSVRVHHRSAIAVAPARRDVRVSFFNFGKSNSGAAAPVGGRGDYTYEDCEEYFNYMGILAVEGCMDRMEALLKDRQPIDVILLFAAEENDSSKIGEILKAGANPHIKGMNGKTALELTTKDEVKTMLKEAMAKVPA